MDLNHDDDLFVEETLFPNENMINDGYVPLLHLNRVKNYFGMEKDCVFESKRVKKIVEVEKDVIFQSKRVKKDGNPDLKFEFHNDTFVEETQFSNEVMIERGEGSRVKKGFETEEGLVHEYQSSLESQLYQDSQPDLGSEFYDDLFVDDLFVDDTQFEKDDMTEMGDREKENVQMMFEIYLPSVKDLPLQAQHECFRKRRDSVA